MEIIKIDYFSIFSGVAGFEKGIEQAYENYCSNRRQRTSEGQLSSERTGSQIRNGASSVNDRESSTLLSCVGFSEIDKRAIEIYRYHYPEHKNYGNANFIIADELPDFNLLVAGFPCQSFSIAGKRQGFLDIRGTLFFEIARILETKKPRNFLLENVKGLFSHDSGRTFRTIIQTLTDIGYCVEWDCLNSKFYGVPQNRERVFLVGHFGGIPEREIFPLAETNGTSSQLGGEIIRLNNPAHSNKRIYSSDGVSPSLDTAQGGQRQPKILDWNGSRNESDMSLREHDDGIVRALKQSQSGTSTIGVEVPRATKRGFETAEEGDSINLAVMGSKTRRGRVGKSVRQTLDTGAQQYTLSKNRIRRLTPVEFERLQGFPDYWSKYGINEKGKKVPMSDAARYRCLGNAVSVPVIEAIILKMIEAGRFTK